MPSTGIFAALPASLPVSTLPCSISVMSRDSARRSPPFAVQRVLGALEHVLDHADETELLAVMRRVDARHAVVVQFLDLLRHDDAAAAAEHADVPAAALLEHVDGVLEELDMAALVAGDGDAVGVFLQRGGDDFLHAAVVAEVDDLRAFLLQQAADDVDAGVVAVEQGGGGDEAQRLAGGCGFRRGGLDFGVHAAKPMNSMEELQPIIVSAGRAASRE
jgi:hypothetical protein